MSEYLSRFSHSEFAQCRCRVAQSDSDIVRGDVAAGTTIDQSSD